MEGSVISSIFFAVSFGLLYAGIFRIKKSDKALNGVVWLIMNLVTALCWGTFCAGIINMIRIPVHIVSMGVIYLISAAVLFYKARSEGEIQKYEWKKYDIVYVCLVGGVIFLILFRRITPNLNFMFVNSDAAVHLRNSLNIVRTGTLDTMYFAPLYNGLITETLLPFINEIDTYKVFLAVDAMTLVLEAVFFLVLIRQYLNQMILKVLGIVLGFLYIFGYPMHSYLWSFFYWGIGVMLIGYVLVVLREYMAENIRESTGIFLLMIGCTSVTMCYMLFGPVSYIAVFACLAVSFWKKKQLFSKNTVKISLQIFLIPCVLSIYYCYFMFLKKQNISLGGALELNGAVYRELFINFIWMLPFLCYRLVRSIRQKHLDEAMIFFLCFGMMTFGIGCLAIMGKASSYYYFKFYYPVWMLGFVLTAQALEEIYEESKNLLAAGILMFAAVIGINVTHMENRMMDKGIGLGDRTSQLFDIYYCNKLDYHRAAMPFDEDYLEACSYVMEGCGKTENVPMIATIDSYAYCYWYEALTGEDSSEFYGWHYSVKKIKKKLKQGKVKHFVICKEHPIYTENKNYFDSFRRVYENDKVFVGETN